MEFNANNNNSGQNNSGLLRYRSTPTSSLSNFTNLSSGFCSDVQTDSVNVMENDDNSCNNGFSVMNSQLPPQYPKQSVGQGCNRFMSSIGMDYEGQSKNMGSTLVRQNSSPAGLFSQLNSENGYAGERLIGNYRVADIRLTNGMNFSSLGMLSRITEIEHENGLDEPKVENIGGDNLFSTFGSWNNDSSYYAENFTSGIKREMDDDQTQFVNTEDMEMGNSPHILSRSLSRPKPKPSSVEEISAMEKVLHFHDTVPCKIRAKRGCATHPRSIAERVRRTRISERMRKLQELVPNMDKQTNTSDMLDLAVEYIKGLQKQYEMTEGSHISPTIQESINQDKEKGKAKSDDIPDYESIFEDRIETSHFKNQKIIFTAISTKKPTPSLRAFSFAIAVIYKGFRMPEARDRLSRQDDVLAIYSNRLRNFASGRGNIGRVNLIAFILEDDIDEGQATGTPFRWRGTAMVGTPGLMRVQFGRGSFGTPRIGRVPNSGRYSALAIGRENLSPSAGSARGRSGGRGRGRTVLPSWYPRKPLKDITAVVRAIERRRAHRGESERSQSESPILQDRIHDPSASTSGVQLEHDISMTTPHPRTGLRRCPPSIGKVPKILLNATKNQNDACLTPQKKLLENIEMVEKVVMEELRKLKRTPSAKKAEREKRVRTLLSMR
ncbi:negative regulation of ubiquitin-protein transferase [Castilleja foliolosa]|uniref:Negative regulation of ubiquitin-protein transferase n=1 Tax=Castilleja foliolosa TaxID=1961234 RepID=A0ABD3CSI9_9LAMI